LLAGVVGCAQFNGEQHDITGSSALVALFNQAARGTDVPADVLALWAHMETRFVRVPDEVHGDVAGEARSAHAEPSFGVMGLTAPHMARAAALMGTDIDSVRMDDFANIRAVAVLLRQAADNPERMGGPLSAETNAASWADVMATTRGIPDDGIRDEYRRMVAEHLGHGLTGSDRSGGTLSIRARGEVRLAARQVVYQGLDPEDPYSDVYVTSPHYSSRDGTEVDTIVIHTTQGSYSGAVAWFQNPSSEVSSHYIIRSSDGHITQMVQLENRAWHSGNSNYNARSIGIEHEGYVSDPGRWYTDALYERSAALVRWLAERYNVSRDRLHLIGHYQVPASGSGAPCSESATQCGGAGHHQDPGTGGTGWDWDRFLTLVEGNGATSSSSSSGGSTTSDRRIVGLVYNGSQGPDVRISGATVSLLQDGVTLETATSTSTGFWAFNVTTTGTYQIESSADGFVSNTRDATAASAGDNWASIGLLPAGSSGDTGYYRGVVYAGANLGEDPIDGAVVTLSTGQSYTTSVHGAFVFQLSAGDITATARKAGYQDAAVSRTVVAGDTAWGSIHMVAQDTAAPLPSSPAPISPANDVTVLGVGLQLTFTRVENPQDQEVTYDLELYQGAAVGTPFLTLGSAQSQVTPVAVTVPVDLAAASYLWRVRARSSAGASAWSNDVSFRVQAGASSTSSSNAAASSATASSATTASSSTGGVTGGEAGGPAAPQADDEQKETFGGCSGTIPSRNTPRGALLLAGLLVLRRYRARAQQG
jgi:N-acetyl-anhydromuramyl-L-alanine amidase AmpD